MKRYRAKKTTDIYQAYKRGEETYLKSIVAGCELVFNPDDFEEVEEEKEIERVPVRESYAYGMRGEMYELKTVAAKLDEVIEAVNELKKGGR